MNEVDKFFKGLASEDTTKADIFGEKKPVEKTEVESEDDKPKNRHSRRWEAKYQLERESGIELAAKLKITTDALNAVTESQKFQKSVGSDVEDEGLKSWLKIYGDKPEHREAYNVMKNNIIGPVAQEARDLREQLEEINTREERASKKVKEYQSKVLEEFEKIEDKYNIDITSDSESAEKTRNEFIELIKKLSPKDADGNITSYADIDGAWDIYQSKKSTSEPVNQVRNQIASRSMANQGGNVNVPKQRSRGWDGWKKDLNYKP